MPCHLPYDNAGRDRDIERVFRAVLRYLKASVAHVYDLLLHRMHLIADDNSIAMLFPFGGEEGRGEKRRTLTLLDSKHCEALVVKTTDSITRVLEILPLDALLCSERCLVLVIGYSSVWINETLTKLCALGVEPVLVSVYQHQFGIEYSYVSFNTVEAMRTLVRYVSETGRRGVALFGMHRDTVGDRAKLSGFVSGMHDAGMDFSREDIFYRGMMSDCADRLLKKIDKYETVMCTSDLIAVYLIRYLESKGIRVPEDINITGFGNWKAAESFHPSITRM